MNPIRIFTALMLALVLAPRSSGAQVPAGDPSARLRAVLPAQVAQRVLARIAEARARQLPADALENRALKFAAKGVDPINIERSVNEQASRMDVAKAALTSARASAPAGDEIDAGAEAIRKGVDGSSISFLAKNAPSGRSLAVPLFVIGSLTDRGFSSDDALKRVLARLKARASDTDLESMPGDLPGKGSNGQGNGQGNRSGLTGRDFGQSHKPATAGPPAGVPGNAGKKTNPGQSHRPPKT